MMAEQSLSSVLAALRQADLGLTEKKYLRRIAVEAAIQPPAKAITTAPFVQLQADVLAAAERAGQPHSSLAQLAGSLRHAGHGHAAKRVQKVGRLRNGEAHPDSGLPSLVGQLLQGEAPCRPAVQHFFLSEADDEDGIGSDEAFFPQESATTTLPTQQEESMGMMADELEQVKFMLKLRVEYCDEIFNELVVWRARAQAQECFPSMEALGKGDEGEGDGDAAAGGSNPDYDGDPPGAHFRCEAAKAEEVFQDRGGDFEVVDGDLPGACFQSGEADADEGDHDEALVWAGVGDEELPGAGFQGGEADADELKDEDDEEDEGPADEIVAVGTFTLPRFVLWPGVALDLDGEAPDTIASKAKNNKSVGNEQLDLFAALRELYGEHMTDEELQEMVDEAAIV